MKELAALDSTELARRAQAGERAAFVTLYDRHLGGVTRALASFAGPDRDARDDLVQEVFLRVVRYLPSYRPVQPFERWLFTVTLNVGRNCARDRPKRAVVDIDELRVADRAVPTPEAILDSTDLMRRVAKLPLELREVVALRVGSDLPFDEVAALLEVPPGTARRRMHTAIARLREEIASEAKGEHRDRA